jgi:hypothetical protein
MSSEVLAECHAIADPSAVAKWLLDAGPAPAGVDASWQCALVQCTDTLVWGVLRAGHWRFSSDADRELRRPRLDRLLEARVFGRGSEALLWRTEGRLSGRLLADGAGQEPAVQPRDRRFWFDCEDRGPTDLGDPDFVAYRTPAGRRVVGPCGSGILVRDHFVESVETGLVRLAATRFVEVLP